MKEHPRRQQLRPTNRRPTLISEPVRGRGWRRRRRRRRLGGFYSLGKLLLRGRRLYLSHSSSGGGGRGSSGAFLTASAFPVGNRRITSLGPFVPLAPLASLGLAAAGGRRGLRGRCGLHRRHGLRGRHRLRSGRRLGRGARLKDIGCAPERCGPRVRWRGRDFILRFRLPSSTETPSSSLSAVHAVQQYPVSKRQRLIRHGDKSSTLAADFQQKKYLARSGVFDMAQVRQKRLVAHTKLLSPASHQELPQAVGVGAITSRVQTKTHRSTLAFSTCSRLRQPAALNTA